MPLYDYKCTACAHEFEQIVTTNSLPVVCVQCGNPADKQFSKVGGYKINGDNSASTRPAGGAFKKGK